MFILPQKFDGKSEYLDSFFVQFEIACQINSWPENQKPYRLIKCLEGPAYLYTTSILQSLPAVDVISIKQALYKKYELPQKRVLLEGETVVKYG